MTRDVHTVWASDSVLDTARQMADLGVGALPIFAEDNHLAGVVTDRDIVVRVLAAGKDPMAMHTGELAQEQPVTVNVGDDVEDVLNTMERHQVRRVPVLDGQKLAGIISLADIARALPDRTVGTLVEALSVD
jgi:CBS domain-containing protein